MKCRVLGCPVYMMGTQNITFSRRYVLHVKKKKKILEKVNKCKYFILKYFSDFSWILGHGMYFLDDNEETIVTHNS